jgi:mannitol-1-/sugar-/sorbitol-6-/2-deoxyglucose-6-phosphatase
MDKAVIFDMDGLMLDSAPTWIAAENRLFADFGKKRIPGVDKKYHGLRVSGMIKVMIKEYKLPVNRKKGERLLKEYARFNFLKPSVKLLPGCINLIKNLRKNKKYLMAIASSSPKNIIKTVIKRLISASFFVF